MKRQTKIHAALTGVAVATVLGTLSLVMLEDQVHCNDVKEQGRELKLEAEAAGADRLGEQIAKTEQMLQLVDDNRSCFTESELAEVEVGRKILEDMGVHDPK